MKSAKTKPCKSFSGISTTATRRAALLVFLTWQGYDLNAHLEPRAVQCYPFASVLSLTIELSLILKDIPNCLAILKPIVVHEFQMRFFVLSFSGWHLCVAGPCVLVNQLHRPILELLALWFWSLSFKRHDSWPSLSKPETLKSQHQVVESVHKSSKVVNSL